MTRFYRSGAIVTIRKGLSKQWQITGRPETFRQKKARRTKLWRNIGIVAGVVAFVAIVLVSYFTSTTYYRQKTAVEIGDHDISVAAFNYYYQNAYQNTYSAIQETYGDYASMIIDTSTPLDEQQ